MSATPDPGRRDIPSALSDAISTTTTTMRRPIVFDGTSTPVKTALFVIICFAWLFPGLIGHDPWKTEATTFGIIYAMLREGNWLTPMVAGVANYDYPPLYYWVAAFTAKIFSPFLPLHDGARLASGFFLAITLFFTHRTAKRLFDERAGRISVVLLIGSLGILLRSHEMSPELAGLAGVAIAFYGMTRIRSESTKGGITTGLGMGVIAISIGVVPALAIPTIAVVLMWILGEWRNRTFQRGVAVAVLTSLPFMLLLPIGLAVQGTIPPIVWVDTILGAPFLFADTRSAINPLYFIRSLPWVGLPAFPFAAWLWWKDRKKVRDRFELALPLTGFLVLLVCLSFLREANDAAGLVILVPLALAAACVLDRLPRGIASFMDWFSLLAFGLAAIAVWLYWTAAITGLPEAAARAMARQVPGFEFSFNWVPFCCALTLTLVWLYAVIRAHRSNRRAVVNWTAGVTLVWMRLNMLGLPAVNHVQSYRATAQGIAAQISPSRTCVASVNLGDAQRAMLDYFAALRFVPVDSSTAASCDWLLAQGTKEKSPAVDAKWQLVWEGSRPGDNVERLRVYRR
ncbi:MAG: glycosyltransferase family 39 protein [Usitatibacteraceae bacterium]